MPTEIKVESPDAARPRRFPTSPSSDDPYGTVSALDHLFFCLGRCLPMAKLPAFQFYPGDWLRDSVSGCSLAAQGLWLRMMIIMHDSPEYGYLTDNGEPMKPEVAARRCGCSLEEYERLLDELFQARVPRLDKVYIIHSKRMIEDEKKRKRNSEKVRKYRDIQRCNRSVTEMLPPSSSSSSPSKKKRREKGKPSLVVGDGNTPPCPHDEIVRSYHKILPMLPKVNLWDEPRQKLLRTRWREDKDRQTIDWWNNFFEYVASSGFLTGQNNDGWMADLEWLVRPSNFGKIANGRYHRGKSGRSVSSTTSRNLVNLQAWLEGKRNDRP